MRRFRKLLGEALESRADLHRVRRLPQSCRGLRVRTKVEKYGMGWTMWDYSGGFAVMLKQEGRTIPNE